MSQVVALPPYGYQCYVNNRFRQDPNEPALQFRIPQFAQLASESRTFLLSVKQVIFQNFIPNIRTGVNDTLKVTATTGGVSTSYTFTLTQGNYNIGSMITALNTAFQASINVGFVWSYNTDLFRMKLTVPSGYSIVFISPPMNQSAYITGRHDFSNATDRLLETLGLYTDSDTTITTGTYTFSDPFNFLNPQFMMVNLNANINVMSSDPANRQTLVCVPLGTSYGSVVDYEVQTPNTCLIQAGEMDILTLYCTDQWGQLINVPQNTSFMIHFLLIPLQAGGSD